MTTETAQSAAPNRRALFTGALAGAVSLAVGATAAKAAILGNDAELLALIAEEERLRNIGTVHDARLHRLIRERAPEIRRDLYRMIAEDRLPEPMASVYAESARYIDAADEIGMQIHTITPQTIAGVIALIEFSGADYENDAVKNALAGLRTITAKGGAP